MDNRMTEEAEKPAGGIDPKLIETLGEIASRLDLSEIEVKHGGLEIRIARKGMAVVAAPAVAAPAAAATPAPVPAPAAAAPVEHPGTVKSPMVGTAYLRPSPDQAAFVTVGATVKSGDKILLVEAMKTFNEIIAPRGGTVRTILVEDGQPVEYGQPLLVIE
jgi:acetyl-CoA carboxylase biotin carboxyl carrier protein